MRAFYETMKGRIAAIGRRRQPIRTREAFRAFVEGEAALVAQSATYDYLRARAGRLAPQLFREQPFLDALEVTRWEAFAAVLADLMVIGQTALRTHAVDRTALCAALAELYRQTLARHPTPGHRADGWRTHESDLARRLNATCDAAPQTPDAIASHSGAAIFAHLPLHPDVRRHDEDMVVNNVRFRVLRSWETFMARVDLPAVAADLVVAAGVKQA
jgi:hypothetical protein